MLTYNDLYEVIRKEKYNEMLQQLPKNFLEDLSTYLKEIKEQSSQEADIFSDAGIKSKKQMENALSLFRELMRLRKKKILNLAFVGTETGIMKRDYENLLSFEREVFDKIVKTFEEGDKALSALMSSKKEKSKFKMIMFNQNVQQFVDMTGAPLGPYSSGQLANLDSEIADLFVAEGKASVIEN